MKLRNIFITLLFVVCALNLTFAQITPVEIINTFAGNGSSNYSGDGGAATSAGMYNPIAVTLDSSGNLYTTDENSSALVTDRVRKINAITGIITTVAGGGSCTFYNYAAGADCDGLPATSLGIIGVTALAFDHAGNLYVAGNVVFKVDASTETLKRVAGNGLTDYTGDGGLAVNAELYPMGIAFDSSNNMYIADIDNDVIRKVNATTGVITTIAGTGANSHYAGTVCFNSACYTGDGGPATSALLNFPYGIAIDANNNIYFSDFGNNVIRKVTAGTGIITTVAGNGYEAGSYPYAGGYSGDGGPATQAELNHPTKIALDGSGNLYISDLYNNVIRKVVLSTGIITTFAGNGNKGYSGDGGPASNATFGTADGISHGNSLAGLAATSTGNLYIADARNNVIREVVSGLTNPTFSPVAGTYGLSQSVSIADSVSGTAIHYTTDGTTPSTSSPEYGGTIPVTATTTINAIATATGYPNSGVSTATYTIIESPTISPSGGVFIAPQSVTISDATPGVTIYYTTNGTSPTTGSTVYTLPFMVSATATVQAIAVSSGGVSSQAASQTFTILTVPPSVATYSASNITSTGATLIGYVDPNGFATTYWFAYGTSPGNLNLQTAQVSLASGNSYVPVSIPVTGLAANTTYYFQVVATSSGGSSSGTVLSFKTN